MSEQRVVAVVGASRHRGKFGNKAVRAYRAAGWRVYPIHPLAAAIEGIPAAASVLDVPEHVDRATVYLPPERVLAVLPEIARKNVGEMWLNPGAESPDVVAAARELGIITILDCSIVAIGRSPSNPEG